MLCYLADLAGDATVLSGPGTGILDGGLAAGGDNPKLGKYGGNSSINHDTSINGRVPLPGFIWYLDGLMGDWMVGLLWLLVH